MLTLDSVCSFFYFLICTHYVIDLCFCLLTTSITSYAANNNCIFFFLIMQEELTSTSVEHIIVNPNAAYDKFKDKKVGTKGLGEYCGKI